MSYILFALIFGLLWTAQKAEDIDYEDELRKYLNLDKLRENPNKALVRPVLEPNHTVTVHMGLGVSHITELDESKELLNIMVWRSMLTYFLEDENNQWKIVRSWGQQNIYKYSDNYSWHTLEFHIVLRRRNAYFGLTLIMPMIMTMFITLIGFWLPWDSTRRLILCQTNLVLLTVLSAHLYWVIPRSGSNVPGIVICCGNSMLFASFSLILTVICLKISRQTPSMSVPNIFRNVLQGIPARILGLGDGLAAIKDGGLLNSYESSSSPEEEATSSKEETNLKAEWIIFMTALNRMAFYMFLIIYISILLSTFA